MSQPLAQSPQTTQTRSPYPTEPKPYKPGFAERLYLPLLGGMW